ncbi:Mu transposase C-terminal domain-containing protein [Streptomyces sp. NBC_01262]|uniref:Mu transposase C-terminal domain-containing protein n=1 Tax=Streptomyces sp. NBC_01262 TaxID=2903803 RepID=UPI002E2EB4D4|nr:Mu transposase C-terminal domain-containing protein [Streptomyces sp. NBC_01262]
MNAPPPPPPPDLTQLRALSTRLLLEDAEQHQIVPGRLTAVAQTYGVHPRTVRRWLDNARANDGTYTPAGRPHFQLTEHMLNVVARWRGNVTRAHEELTAEAKADPKLPPVPARATFHRAVHRQLNRGQLAGLRAGEQARRAFDVFGKRERHWRNYAWETDHVEASVKVSIDGHIRKPWITWFVDCATDGICGLAITPQTPSRESILVALRDALLTTSRHGPFGGRPQRLRVDGGKDFLCRTVDEATTVLGTELIVLPPRRPDLKPTVEAVNGAVKKMLFADMPGYTEAATLPGGKPIDPDQQLLHFEVFVALVLDWVRRWNTEHTIEDLDGKTPAQVWAADPTPIKIITPRDIHTFTLERLGKPLTINNDGVRWRKRSYVADWMVGRGGEKVHLRYMPHHDYRVELYDPATGTYLGHADCTNQISPATRRALDKARRREADQLRARQQKAERNRTARYAAVSQTTQLLRLDNVTQEQALEELRALGGTSPGPDALPGFLPLPTPTDGWAVPRPRKKTGKDTP